MRRCFNIDYPRRADTDDQGRVVAVRPLSPVKCRAVAVMSSTVIWQSGEKQRIYTCDVHADKLKKITEDAGFTWKPRPYAPKES